MTIPRIIGMLSGLVDPATKDVVFTVKGDDGAAHEMRVHPGVVGNLTIALLGFGNSIAAGPAQTGIVAQVMHLNGVRPAIGPHGELVLELNLENGLRLPVTFPPEAIQVLQNALKELEKMPKPNATPAQRH